MALTPSTCSLSFEMFIKNFAQGLPYYLAHSTMVLWPVCTTFDSPGNGLISKHGLIQKEYSVVDP